MKKEPIHEKCEGCGRVMEDSTCSTYLKPGIWWRIGGCPLADHIKKTESGPKRKIRVGQQKQKRKKR